MTHDAKPTVTQLGTAENAEARQPGGPKLGAEPHLGWLDDQEAPEVREWATAQDAATRAALDASGLRDESHAAVRAIVDRSRVDLPETVSGLTIERRRAPGEDQSSVWVRLADGDERKLIDPLEIDPSGTTAITLVSPSPDGALVAWATAPAGSDWQPIRVRDVASGEDLPDLLEWVKDPQAVWAPDSTGFCYLSFEAPTEGNALLVANHRNQVRFHVLGSDPADDRVVFEHPSAQWLWATAPAALGRLVVEITDGTTVVEITTATWEDALERGAAAFTPIVTGNDEVSLIGANANELVWCSFAEDSDGAFIATSPETGERRDLAPVPGPVDVWRAAVTDRYLVTAYHSSAPLGLATLRLADGETREIALPDGLWVRQIDALEHGDVVRMRLAGHALGERDAELDLATGEWRVLRDTLELERTRSEVRAATSADGTSVPYVVVRSADDDGSRPRPTLMVGYGGYGVDFLRQGFEEWHQAWLDTGGVLALIGIRGGSEHGAAWHDAAVREHKQRSYDDAIACAEALIAEGVTTRAQLAPNGMSNGGLLVGALLTQRPDLWGATVPEVGVMDLLRFHEFTVGAGWIREFGDPREPEDRARLASLSPFHQLREGVEYPPTLVVTADHDDRVVPGAHSYRFLARMHEVNGDPARHFLRVEPDAGHAVGKGTTTVVRERGDILTFLRMTISAARPSEH